MKRLKVMTWEKRSCRNTGIRGGYPGGCRRVLFLTGYTPTRTHSSDVGLIKSQAISNDLLASIREWRCKKATFTKHGVAAAAQACHSRNIRRLGDSQGQKKVGASSFCKQGWWGPQKDNDSHRYLSWWRLIPTTWLFLLSFLSKIPFQTSFYSLPDSLLTALENTTTKRTIDGETHSSRCIKDAVLTVEASFK